MGELTGQRPQKRGLAASAGTHEGAHASARHLERDAREHGGLAAALAHREVLDPHGNGRVGRHRRRPVVLRPLVAAEEPKLAKLRNAGGKLAGRQRRDVEVARAPHEHDARRQRQPPARTMVHHE